MFVESVLRVGVPPQFASFVVKPNHSKSTRLRSELIDVFGLHGHADKGGEAGDDEAGEYYPYVYLPITPVTQKQ